MKTYTPAVSPSISLLSGSVGVGVVVTTCGAVVGLKEAVLVPAWLEEEVEFFVGAEVEGGCLVAVELW